MKTKWSLPVCAKYKAINMYNEENDVILITGYIRKICNNNNYTMPAQYLVKIISDKYYSNEKIYLFCSSVDECSDYLWGQNVESHNFYRLSTWIFSVDILFE